MLTRVFLAAICCVTAVVASAQGDAVRRVGVANPRALMVAAIDSPNGEAHGVLVGEMAQAIQTRLPGTTPVYIDVTTEMRYSQPGCSRLKLTFWQEGAQTLGEAHPRKHSVDVGINYCRDGLPPKSLS